VREERRAAGGRAAPIGVFDSGIGGLTVLRAIRRLLPRESTLYLGDTARVPYGPKSPATVRRYALEAAAFLLGRGVKMIVVACNTATARALPEVAGHVAVPVLGVVEPGARMAAETSAAGRIGVIGTRGTIESGAYEMAIRRRRPGAEVFTAPCPLFVALVEEGWTDGEIARLTAERYLNPLLERGIDTLVLGCTHYPLLGKLIGGVTGPAVTLVDSAGATAEEVRRTLAEKGALCDGDRPTAHYAVTDEGDRFAELVERFLGEAVGALERVTLDSST